MQILTDQSQYNNIHGKIGLIDADLLDGGTRFPNLVIEKLSGYYKERGLDISLICSYKDLDPSTYDTIFLSRVFDFTEVPEEILAAPNVYVGGTGFFFDKATPLPYSIEHHMPDYHIYDRYIELNKTRFKAKNYFDNYNYSVGFATRGCFRQCPFCVNQNYKKVEFNAHISEFYDPSTKGIVLLDDNILGYSKWHEILTELHEINRPFMFKQGMDIRLMTVDKAKMLNDSKYIDRFIFAFDNINDRPQVEHGLAIWREYCKRRSMLYVLTGFYSQDAEDIKAIFERCDVLEKYDCLPYLMRHKNYLNSPYKGLYISLARWMNQHNMFKNKTFREFVNVSQSQIKREGFIGADLRALRQFENDCPEIAKKWFDKRYNIS